MHFKSIRIIGNDTIVEERQIDLNSGDDGMNFSFRFDGDMDSLIGNESSFRFNFDFDSLFQEQFQQPFQFRNFFGEGNISVGTPTFSVEDVAIYSEKNRVKDFYIKPVPGQNILLVEAKLDNKKTIYSVYDHRGTALVYEKIRRGSGGDFRRVIRMDNLKSGTYFVEIKNGKSIKKKRIILQ